MKIYEIIPYTMMVKKKKEMVKDNLIKKGINNKSIYTSP